MSRVHVNLLYSSLDSVEKRKICDHLLARLSHERDEVRIGHQVVDYIKYTIIPNNPSWNGRKLRNGTRKNPASEAKAHFKVAKTDTVISFPNSDLASRT